MQKNNEFLVSEMQKKLGVTDFVSEIKRVENYPDFERLAHVIQHGLQGFIAKNIEGESTEENDLRGEINRKKGADIVSNRSHDKRLFAEPRCALIACAKETR